MKTNLLEYAQKIVQLEDEFQAATDYDEAEKILNKQNLALTMSGVDLCRAVLAGMEEIEKASDDSLKSKSHSTYSDDWWNGLATAYKNSANILRKHLGAEEEK